MKKFISLFVVLTMLLLSVSASADTINWTDWEEAAYAFDAKGQFQSVCETGLSMWVPSVFSYVDLWDSLGGHLEVDDPRAWIDIHISDAEGESLSDYALSLSEYESTVGLSEDVINGISAITYIDTEMGPHVVTVQKVDGVRVSFCFYIPESAEEQLGQAASCMIASIQLAE